ncbi:ProQ/FINO family protein [Endozoicomonas atrinae]|uniref:ProQ/FINO family protein n=1 Tax=Endozoicomonas atrinae TaxID=1333660 RepID=UPI000824DC01|nr:ProQ/FINO family protein [Endozoicomonas atrinae]
MTAEKSNISDQSIQEQEKQLAPEQDGSAMSQELPEEARKILERLHNRPESDVMNSEALRLVRILWPSAFNVSDPRPLKIGIHKEMAEANLLPEHIIPVALRFFTSMERYLEKIKPGATRINLQGQAAGRVKLREAVDAEIKLYTQSSDFITTRDRVIIKKIRLLSVNKQA